VEDVKVMRSKSLPKPKFKINNEGRPADIESYGAVATHDLLRPRPNGLFEKVESITFFDNKKVRYLWSPDAGKFVRVSSFDKNIPCAYFHTQNGLSRDEQDRRRVLFGNNEIEVRVQTIFQILFNEVLGPFYVFQVCSIILWAVDDYVMYASCIVVMSSLSLISSVLQIRKNQKQLRDTVVGADVVKVQRENGTIEEIASGNLVPGDVIMIPSHGCIMQCDAVLISGTVIVNESMLTGESVPVTKIPLLDTRNEFDAKEHAKNTLFCGTKAIQTRFYDGAKVKAVVIRTGFQTAKGELVRSIMFPKPVDFKFNRKSDPISSLVTGL
jgi:cation-transporting ATPase 13A3/4/5